MAKINPWLGAATALFVILAILSFMFWRRRKESFESVAAAPPVPEVSFMSATETADLISADADKYVANFTDPDLSARRIQSREAYLARASAAARDFTEAEKLRLKKLANFAAARLRSKSQPKIAALPWKFAVTRDMDYEDGIPHTRGNVIFLGDDALASADSALTKTLVHEQVHVFQKKHPEVIAEYIKTGGYRPIGKRPSGLVRANPDLTDVIYSDARGTPNVALYKSAQPRFISDIVGITPEEEGPEERMAYEIAN